MTLLAFEDTTSSPVGDLMDVAQRQKTASELNAAILCSQCQASPEFADLPLPSFAPVCAASLFPCMLLVGPLPVEARCQPPLPFLVQEQEPRLPSLLKMMIWAQERLDEHAVYPKINDLTTAELSEPSASE